MGHQPTLGSCTVSRPMLTWTIHHFKPAWPRRVLRGGTNWCRNTGEHGVSLPFTCRSLASLNFHWIWSNQGDLAHTSRLSAGHEIFYTEGSCASPVRRRCAAWRRWKPLAGQRPSSRRQEPGPVGDAGQREVLCKVGDFLLWGHGSPGDWSMTESNSSQAWGGKKPGGGGGPDRGRRLVLRWIHREMDGDTWRNT